MAGQTISAAPKQGILDSIVHGVQNFFNGNNATNAAMPQRTKEYKDMANYFTDYKPYASDTGASSGPQATGVGTVAVQTDPYARYGGYAAYQNMVNQYAGQKQSLLDSINQRIGQDSQQYGYNVEDLFNSSRAAQDAINQKSAQNELSRIQGRADILGKVSRGIRSGNVMLGQKNASNSSAAAAIANAYGDIGNRDNQKVEQGYQVNNENIATDQKNFDLSRNTNARRLEESKANIINNIVNEATSQLQALDAQIAGASLPNRIAIEQEKNRIRSDASGKLSAFDAQLNQARGITGYTADERRQEAQRLASLGTAAASPFQFSPETDFQQQSQYNPDLGLPIYTIPKKRV